MTISRMARAAAARTTSKPAQLEQLVMAERSRRSSSSWSWQSVVICVY
jgi:hypothetical protein